MVHIPTAVTEILQTATLSLTVALFHWLLHFLILEKIEVQVCINACYNVFQLISENDGLGKLSLHFDEPPEKVKYREIETLSLLKYFSNAKSFKT